MSGDNPLDQITAVDFAPPRGWERRPGVPGIASLYRKKKLRLGASETRGVMMVSISKERHGRPTHPTDAQCREVLEAFGLAGLKEVTITMTARYFKPSMEGAS